MIPSITKESWRTFIFVITAWVTHTACSRSIAWGRRQTSRCFKTNFCVGRSNKNADETRTLLFYLFALSYSNFIFACRNFNVFISFMRHDVPETMTKALRCWSRGSGFGPGRIRCFSDGGENWEHPCIEIFRQVKDPRKAKINPEPPTTTRLRSFGASNPHFLATSTYPSRFYPPFSLLLLRMQSILFNSVFPRFHCSLPFPRTFFFCYSWKSSSRHLLFQCSPLSSLPSSP